MTQHSDFPGRWVPDRLRAATWCRWNRLSGPKRLVIGAAVCLVVLAVSVFIAVVYAAQRIDAAVVDDELQRTRGAVARLAADDVVLTPDRVARLGADLGLQNLRLIEPGLAGPDEVTLPSSVTDGLVLAWEPRQLGSEMFAILAPIRLITAAVFLGAIGIAFFKLYRLAEELEARRKAADTLARRDALTGLGNRLGFDEAMSKAVASGQPFGVVTFDLDGFKRVNDTRGHSTGDELLRIIAARLDGRRIGEDCAARIGGDEFAMLRRDIAEPEQLDELVADLSLTLAEPIVIGTVSHRVSSSFGSALYPLDGADADTLMRIADAALYRSKRDSAVFRVTRRELGSRAS
jgi:diguanylate cyclase (GGDEF)-like protein